MQREVRSCRQCGGSGSGPRCVCFLDVCVCACHAPCPVCPVCPCAARARARARGRHGLGGGPACRLAARASGHVTRRPAQAVSPRSLLDLALRHSFRRSGRRGSACLAARPPSS